MELSNLKNRSLSINYGEFVKNIIASRDNFDQINDDVNLLYSKNSPSYQSIIYLIDTQLAEPVSQNINILLLGSNIYDIQLNEYVRGLQFLGYKTNSSFELGQVDIESKLDELDMFNEFNKPKMIFVTYDMWQLVCQPLFLSPGTSKEATYDRYDE